MKVKSQTKMIIFNTMPTLDGASNSKPKGCNHHQEWTLSGDCLLMLIRGEELININRQ